MKKAKRAKTKTKKRSPSIDHFTHLERMILRIDQGNDSLERKVFVLSLLSVLLTLVGFALVLFHVGAN